MGRRGEDSATTTRRIGDLVVVSPASELDMATAPGFIRAVEHVQDQSPIVVDLRELTFIDSMGIRALIQAAGGLDRDSNVSFVRASDRIQRILGLAGIEPALRWTDAPAEPASEAI